MSEYSKLAKNTIIFAIGQFSVKFIQFFLMPVLTVAMTTEDYGSAESIASLVELVIPLFTLGLQDAVFRFCMRDDMQKKAVLSSSMAVAFIGILIIFLGSAVATVKLPVEQTVMFAVLYVCYALSNIWGQFIRGAGYIKTFACCGVVQALMLAGGTAVFVYWQRWGTFGYLLSMAIAYLCSIVVMFFGGKIYKQLSFKAINKAVLKDMLKYALPLIPNAISWWFIQVVNRFIIIGCIGDAAAGLYISSAKIATIINIFGTVFLQAWTISTVSSLNNGNKGEFNTRIFKIFSAFIQFAAFIILLLLPYLSMFLLKGEFYEAWRYSSVAIYTAIFSCYSSFFGTYYGANMNTKVALYSTLAAAVVNTGFSFLLINFLGIQGVLFASLLSYVVLAVIRIITTQKYSEIKINWFKEAAVLLLLLADSCMILYSENIPAVWYFGAQAVAICLFLIIKFKDIKLFAVYLVSLCKKLFMRKKSSDTQEAEGADGSAPAGLAPSAVGGTQMKNEIKIEDIQAVQLDLLEKFAELCGKLGLKYTLSSGSLLGAVRHGGFVPWDDDIDVAMPREDYEIFVKNANGLLPSGYFVQHFTTEKDAPNVFAKLRNSNTAWICYEHEKLNINHGIGMDIFPVDRVLKPEKLNRIARKTHTFLTLQNCYEPSYIKTIKSAGKKFIACLIFPLSRIIGKRRLLIKQDKFNKDKKSGEWTTADVILRNKLMPYKIFEEYEETEFEGKLFSTVKERDEYLKIVYGDNYMDLPPLDKRVVHVAKIVDCHASYTQYIDNHDSAKSQKE